MPWDHSFEVWGENFYPSRVPFTFTEQHDPGAIGKLGRHRGKPVPYGSATYRVPRDTPIRDRIKHLAQTMEPILPAIREAGATDWYISIGRYFYAECSEEYSLEEIQMVARLGCYINYSAYTVSEEEEKRLEKEC